MAWGSLGLVITRHSCSSQSWVTLAGCHYFAFRAARPAVFAALVFGTNCLPCFIPARFLRLVAAYSAADKLEMAFLGR